MIGKLGIYARVRQYQGIGPTLWVVSSNSTGSLYYLTALDYNGTQIFEKSLGSGNGNFDDVDCLNQEAYVVGDFEWDGVTQKEMTRVDESGNEVTFSASLDPKTIQAGRVQVYGNKVYTNLARAAFPSNERVSRLSLTGTYETSWSVINTDSDEFYLSDTTPTSSNQWQAGQDSSGDMVLANVGEPSWNTVVHNNDIRSVYVSPNNDIYTTGSYTQVDIFSRDGVCKYFSLSGSFGNVDINFNVPLPGTPTCYDIRQNNSGETYVVGNFSGGIRKVNRTTGAIITSFTTNIGLGANDEVRKVRIDKNGQLYLGGHFSSFNGTTRNGVCRLNSDGTLDTSFGSPLPSGRKVISIALNRSLRE